MKYILSAVTLSIAFVSNLTSCSTGIENTKMIKMSRADKKQTSASEEEILASNICSQFLSDWKIGKRFLITDDKASLILGYGERVADEESTSIRGHVITFAGISTKPDAGGAQILTLNFADDARILSYITGRQKEDALKNLSGSDLPLMIDLDLVDKADSLLRGKTLWTKTGLWYGDDHQIVAGRKFVPVVIDSIKPGNSVFPFILDFKDAAGQPASLFMNTKSATGIGAESRTFPSLFSLTDPKLKYPSIEPETWNLIQQGKVKVGMTKDECKLSLGNPTDVDAGHNWSSAIDLWKYKDGTFLRFENGLLVNFR